MKTWSASTLCCNHFFFCCVATNNRVVKTHKHTHSRQAKWYIGPQPFQRREKERFRLIPFPEQKRADKQSLLIRFLSQVSKIALGLFTNKLLPDFENIFKTLRVKQRSYVVFVYVSLRCNARNSRRRLLILYFNILTLCNTLYDRRKIK